MGASQERAESMEPVAPEPVPEGDTEAPSAEPEGVQALAETVAVASCEVDTAAEPVAPAVVPTKARSESVESGWSVPPSTERLAEANTAEDFEELIELAKKRKQELLHKSLHPETTKVATQARLDQLGAELPLEPAEVGVPPPAAPAAADPAAPASMAAPVSAPMPRGAPNIARVNESPAIAARRQMMEQMRHTLEWVEGAQPHQVLQEQHASTQQHEQVMKANAEAMGAVQQGHAEVSQLHQELDQLAASHSNPAAMESLRRGSVSPQRGSPRRSVSPNKRAGSPVRCDPDQIRNLSLLEADLKRLADQNAMLERQLSTTNAAHGALQQQYEREKVFNQQLQSSLEEFKQQSQEHLQQERSLRENQHSRELAEAVAQAESRMAEKAAEDASRMILLETRAAELEQSQMAEHQARVALETELQAARGSMEQFATQALSSIENSKKLALCQEELKQTKASLDRANAEKAMLRGRVETLETERATEAHQGTTSRLEDARCTLQARETSARLVSAVEGLHQTISKSHDESVPVARLDGLDGNSLRQRVANRMRSCSNPPSHPKTVDVAPAGTSASDLDFEDRLKTELVRRLGLEAYKRMSANEAEREAMIDRLGQEVYQRTSRQEVGDQVDAKDGVIGREELERKDQDPSGNPLTDQLTSMSTEWDNSIHQIEQAYQTRRQEMEGKLSSTKLANHLDSIAQIAQGGSL